MAQTLEDAKSRVSRDVMGRYGVHGIGLRRSENAVVLYVEPARREEIERERARVAALAAPFPVMVVDAERATAG
jgi:hypothetical protein